MNATASTRPVVLLFLFAVLMLGYRLGVEPVDRTSERRCHEVAKTMVASHDYLVPMFEGSPRLQKPPLYYWLASATANVLGETTLFSTRIPSFVAALLLLAIVFSWTQAMKGPRFALLASALLVLSFQFGISGRRGDAEMWLTMTSTAALACFERFDSTGKRSWLYAFGGAFALALLSKATVAFVTVILPIAVLLLRNKQGKKLASREFVIVLLAALVAGFAWYGVILAKVDGAPGQLFGQLLMPFGVKVEALKGDATHRGPPWYYISKIFSVIFPVALVLPLMIVRWKKSALEKTDRSMQFVALGLIAEFVVFSILPQKQKHYLLPLVPLFAIAAAHALRELTLEPRFMKIVNIGTSVLGIAGCVGVAVMAGFAYVFDYDNAIDAAVLLVPGALLLLAVAIHAVRSSRENFAKVLALFVAAEMCLMAYYHGRFQPWHSMLGDAADGDTEWARSKQVLADADAHKKLTRYLAVDADLADLRKRLAKAETK